MSCNNSRKTSTVQYTLQRYRKITSEPPTPRLSANRNKGNEVLTLTIPATNAPQLNVPMSFGIEINLQPQIGAISWTIL
jgi:hypothetical protein